jgi:CheY-like chemotaxis protein
MSSLDGLSILMVDDDDANREVLGLALGRLGARVAVALSGAEARRLLAEQSFDVLVCDLSLGDTESGMQLVASLPQVKAKKVFAIAVTGWADHDARKRALASGFDAFFPKPVKLDQLVALLKEKVRPAG